MTAAPQYTTWRELFRRVTGQDDHGNKVNEPQPLTADEAYHVITGYVRLPSGGGTLYGNKKLDDDASYKTELCVMQTVNLYNALITGTLPTGDGAEYLLSEEDYSASLSYHEVDEVDPVIESMMVAVNDGIAGSANRQKLMRLVPKLLNTKIDEATSERVRVAKQIVLDMAGTAYDEWIKFDTDLTSANRDILLLQTALSASPMTYDDDKYVRRSKESYLQRVESRYDMLEDAWTALPKIMVEMGRIDEAIDLIDKMCDVKA